MHAVGVTDGLDGVAASFHGFLRSLPSHPRRPTPVNLNVWEAVRFRHDLAELTHLADLAAGIGVERSVLDDGWFGSRRDDTAGLGDWVVSADVWPAGLSPLVDHVTSLGMEFGLWFEPEMINPDSDLYRAHPDWVLAAGDRTPLLQRNQLVLDLSRPEVRSHLLEQISAVLSTTTSGTSSGTTTGTCWRPGLRAADRPRPSTSRRWASTSCSTSCTAGTRASSGESCASGGGRVDLGILELTQRVWTSDVTDALSRQGIQRWSVQLVDPEYLGAHVSAPVSQQTRRTFSLAFRAATALFGSFRVEWDITKATTAELVELHAWIDLYKDHRELLHTGRMVRVWTPPTRQSRFTGWSRSTGSPRCCGCRDSGRTGSTARGGLARTPRRPAERHGPVVLGGAPVGAATVTGAVLAAIGLPVPPRRPETVTLIHLEAV